MTMETSQVSETDMYYHVSSVDRILDKVASAHNLNRKELEHYKDAEVPKDKYSLIPNTRTNKTGLCLAKKQDGQQCTRRCRDGSNFCGKHIKSHKFGCITDDTDEQYDTIQMKPDLYQGEKVLVDSDGIVYKYVDGEQDSVEIIGKKSASGHIVLIGELENQKQGISEPKSCDLLTMLSQGQS